VSPLAARLATDVVVAVARKIATHAAIASALVAIASASSCSRPRCPTIAVSARLYSGSAAIDPSAGIASLAIRRSSSRSRLMVLLIRLDVPIRSVSRHLSRRTA
jgi:hypothetical protein